jgi:hypothetical protein
MNDAPDAPRLPPRPARGLAVGGPFMWLTPCEDESDIRTIICGQSHARSVMQAIVAPQLDGADSPGPALARRLGFAGLIGRRGTSAEAVLDHAAAQAQHRHLALMWRGNQNNRDFLFATEPLLDLVRAADPDAPVEAAAALVPEAVVRAHLQPSVEPLEKLLASVGAASGCRRFVLGTPPPLHDADLLRGRLAAHIEALHPANAARVRGAGDATDTLPIMPAAIRRKLWLVLQDLLAEAAARNGAEFVPVPAQSLDQYGCLAPRYSIGDISHTTIGYGLLVLQDLAARLDG